jgi:hypothetical protein
MPYPAGMRQRGRRAFRELLAAATACVLQTLAVAPAGAQPAAAPLVVQRAPDASDCPDATALAARVEKLTGRRALEPATTSVDGFAFEVQILKSDDGYTAIVLAAGKSRQIADPGPTCESLEGALALTLAILVDADAEPPPAPPPPPPPAAPAPPPTVPFVPPPPPPPPPAPPRLLVSPSIGLAGGLSGSLVPALTLTAEGRVIGPLSILGGFTWMPSQDFTLPPGRVEVQLMFGQLAACAGAWGLLGRVRAGGCLQVNVGGLRGKGIGYPENAEVVRPWTSFGLAGLLDVALVGPLFASARLGLFAIAPQEAFQVDNVGVAFDPPPVGVLAGAGVGVRIF